MDLQITVFINKLGAGTFLDSISTLISSKPLLVALWLVLLITTCFFNKQHRYAIFLAAAISIIIYFSINDWFFKDFLSNFFELRIRPYLAYPDLITPLGVRSVDSSFPSGHMASTVLFVTIFIYYSAAACLSGRQACLSGRQGRASPLAEGELANKKFCKAKHHIRTWLIWLLGILFALAMAFSRIHNGMHYPTDILAGAILGIVYGTIGIYTATKLCKQKRYHNKT